MPREDGKAPERDISAEIAPLLEALGRFCLTTGWIGALAVHEPVKDGRVVTVGTGVADPRHFLRWAAEASPGDHLQACNVRQAVAACKPTGKPV